MEIVTFGPVEATVCHSGLQIGFALDWDVSLVSVGCLVEQLLFNQDSKPCY